MQIIKLLAYAKINPYLHILGKREDGYHELDLEFQSVSLADEITISEADELELVCTPSPTDRIEDNIAYKAAAALQKKAGVSNGASIEIKKSIPAGAGLGGGSADAAGVLVGLNRLWGLRLTFEELAGVGNELGSDIAFCLLGGRAKGSGRGEILTKLPDLPRQWLVLVKPGFSVSTAWAYKSFDLAKCQAELANHLESVVLKEYPEINKIKEQLLNLGAEKSLMSGSGSTVFGIMPDKETADAVLLNMPDSYWKTVCHTVNEGIADRE
ncbi:MAG: 4-(cytidine 5'-diphospho)-2-C-methyl-D-erythritol kinase [Candidatus Margulisiibacteriota bacterium]